MKGILLKNEGNRSWCWDLCSQKWDKDVKKTTYTKSLNTLGRHPRVLCTSANYIMTWSLLASGNSTYVSIPATHFKGNSYLKLKECYRIYYFTWVKKTQYFREASTIFNNTFSLYLNGIWLCGVKINLKHYISIAL